MNNQTNPQELMKLAGAILDELDKMDITQVEKVAALKIAAHAVDESLNAQTRAVITSNVIDSTRRPLS